MADTSFTQVGIAAGIGWGGHMMNYRLLEKVAADGTYQSQNSKSYPVSAWSTVPEKWEYKPTNLKSKNGKGTIKLKQKSRSSKHRNSVSQRSFKSFCTQQTLSVYSYRREYT